MHYLISQYIDDELNLDEKAAFVSLVHEDAAAKDQTIELLKQEKTLHKLLAAPLPASHAAPWWRLHLRAAFPSAAGFAAAAGVMLLIVLLLKGVPTPRQQADAPAPAMVSHRFVIHDRAIAKAEISGTFTGWKKIPMQPAGQSGYWEVTLPLAAGEHRYIFILDGREQVADPTVPARESDDFGASNSILRVEV